MIKQIIAWIKALFTGKREWNVDPEFKTALYLYKADAVARKMKIPDWPVSIEWSDKLHFKASAAETIAKDGGMRIYVHSRYKHRSPEVLQFFVYHELTHAYYLYNASNHAPGNEHIFSAGDHSDEFKQDPVSMDKIDALFDYIKSKEGQFDGYHKRKENGR